MAMEARVDRAMRAATRASEPTARTMRNLTVPNIIDFVTSPDYLNVPQLYPAQATVLKLIALETDLLTGFDRQLIEKWTVGFVPHDDPSSSHWVGKAGIVPDVLDRAERCQSAGRRWFKEVILVLGRRGSKGFIGSVASAYVLWNLLALIDPQAHYGIVPGKHLAGLVFAGQRMQARVNQWADIAQRVQHAPCFAPYLHHVGADTISIWTPEQLSSGAAARGETPAIEISAKESTPLSARGQPTFLQCFDEMAHMVASGANRSAAEIWDAASPALAQFGSDAFVFEASSPWSMQGRFYEHYVRSLQREPETGKAAAYDTLMLQLPSWALYEAWDRTHEHLAMYPDGPDFAPISRPIITRALLADEQRRDPINYATEYEAQWASSQNAYLDVADVHALFAPWAGVSLAMQGQGSLGTRYTAHADPSVASANFALAVAHLVPVDEDPIPHVVVDQIRVWQPNEFADHKISYITIQQELEQLLRSFPISELTFDQFNSRLMIEALRQFVSTHQHGMPVRTHVDEYTATWSTNWDDAQIFKRALLERRVHAPIHELAFLELQFLEETNRRVDHPSAGPVTTSDIADCLITIVARLLRNHLRPQHDALSNLTPRGALAGGLPLSPRDAEIARSLSDFRRRSQYGHGELRRYPRHPSHRGRKPP